MLSQFIAPYRNTRIHSTVSTCCILPTETLEVLFCTTKKFLTGNLPYYSHLVAVKNCKTVNAYKQVLELEVLIGYLVALIKIPVVYFTAQACDQCWIVIVEQICRTEFFFNECMKENQNFKAY